MVGLISKLMDTLAAPAADTLDQLEIERVSVLILVEIARADHVIEDIEQREISRVLQNSSSLSIEEIDELIAEVLNEADNMLSLHNHVSAINNRVAKSEKIALVEQMWRVALADGSIDRYEEYTIRKLCDLIHVKHRDFMQAKHRILNNNT